MKRPPLLTDMLNATEAAVRFYDRMRTYDHDRHTEQAARIQAELYLRRKVEGLDANTAAELLADALARRAELRADNEYTV